MVINGIYTLLIYKLIEFIIDQAQPLPGIGKTEHCRLIAHDAKKTFSQPFCPSVCRLNLEAIFDKSVLKSLALKRKLFEDLLIKEVVLFLKISHDFWVFFFFAVSAVARMI